jgi:hypothetical protein
VRKADGLRLDDLFLGIGGVILVETYIVATVIVKWVRALNAALAEGDLLYVLENAPKLVRYWYSSIATYIFSVVCPEKNASDDSGSLNLGLHGFYRACQII